MSTWYNRKVKARKFKIGDTVRVYNPRRVKGRSPKWQNPVIRMRLQFSRN